MILTPPPLQEPIATEHGRFSGRSWIIFFTALYYLGDSVRQSGTTAQRPTTNLWIGRRYFDTSLGVGGKPIWRDKNNSGWVDATGASV